MAWLGKASTLQSFGLPQPFPCLPAGESQQPEIGTEELKEIAVNLLPKLNEGKEWL